LPMAHILRALDLPTRRPGHAGTCSRPATRP
jgi:hypothetical protein